VQVSYAAGDGLTFNVSATARPVILLLRGVTVGAVSIETSPGAPTAAERVEFPRRVADDVHPLAVAWDDVSPASAHPTAGLREGLAGSAFAAAGPAGSWATVAADDAAAPWQGLHETVVRLPPCPVGAVVRLAHVVSQ
jgi:hypothetical protein